MNSSLKTLLVLSSLLCTVVQAQNMPIVGIFYYSKSGHTQLMAEAVERGVSQVDSVLVFRVSVDQAKTEDILKADAIIIGSPVYNANIAPPVQEFINNWPFSGSPLKDKIGAAFVTAGGISAGEELVQMNILQAMLINGMIIAGGPNWQGAFGASAVTEEEPFNADSLAGPVGAHFLEKGENLGRRIAELVKRFNQ